jgi:hypothetical protein
MRILGIIVMTFMVAVIYGLFLTTMDFMGSPTYNPVNSGHEAANNIYGLFGTMTTEVRRNEGDAEAHNPTIAHKIAMPYAVTADLSAILGGKIEVGLSSLFHAAETHTPPAVHT